MAIAIALSLKILLAYFVLIWPPEEVKSFVDSYTMRRRAMFDDAVFCLQVHALLQQQCDRSIKEIGALLVIGFNWTVSAHFPWVRKLTSLYLIFAEMGSD